MPFQSGNKLGRGRQAGSVNRRTQEVHEICERLQCNPFEVLVLFAKGDWKTLGYDSAVMIKESEDGKSTFMEYTITPELRVQCAKETCRYLYTQKKFVEYANTSTIQDMTPEQKLDAMKEAVKVMEVEVTKQLA